ncbi:MAG TPA: TonB-dependent receptor [Rhizomicrobium sp.]|nr:TonB-dependent receptor [Rhizomicrobium sp.]
MLRGPKRHWLLRTVSAASLSLALCSVSAQAQQQQKFSFDLPQQPLSASLKEYARVSGQQIIFTEDLVQGYVGHPLHGAFSAADALDQLLADTDLTAERAGGAVMIHRKNHVELKQAPPPADMAATLNDQTERVTVTGLIHSLRTNLDIKRNASGLVDAISSEDIGKFPDTDIAAAMQRIPGVTVSRGVSSLGGVPTSTGTATEITVRGFGPSFNETLFDGRKISSGAGRAFDFSTIGADFVSEVDVLKSPDATLSSGAIGATVNIKFPKPFDSPGPKWVTSASATFSPEEGNATPNVNVLLSDTFAHDTLGFLVDGAFFQARTRADHVNIQGWEGTHLDPCQLASATTPCTATLTPSAAPAWFIQDYGLYQETTQETRINGRAAFQWRPADNLVVTVDDNYSRDTLHALQYGYSVWFNAGGLRNVTQNADGTITSFVQNNSPTDFQSQVNGSVLQNNDTGLNVKWDASDKLAVTFDYDHSQAWENPGGKLTSIDSDVGYGPSTPGGTNGTNVGIVLPGGHNLPFPTGLGPNGNANAFIDNGLIGSHVFPMTSDQRFESIRQVKTEAVWTDEDFKITAGYQYVGDHDDAHSSDDFSNNQWQAFAGYGPASNNNGTHGAALPQNLFTQSFSTSNFINGFGAAANLPPQVLKFNAYSVLNYLQGLGNPQTMTVPGFNVGCCNPAYMGAYTLSSMPNGYSQVIEDTQAGYVNVFTHVDIGGMPLRINAGLRDEYTHVITIGLGQQPTSLTVQPSDHTAFLVNFGPTSIVSGHKDYQSLLPNLDLALGVMDDLQVRFDVSRTLTRPPLSEISPVLMINTGQRVGSLVATGGNPGLMPYFSDNVDMSAEWYYQPNSYMSVDVFNKNVTNFIVAGSTQQTINGAIDPTTGRPAIFTVSTNVNGPTANIYGAEFAIQHVFGDTGFGFQLNGTLVGTDKPYDPHDLSISGFAVTGLADSANLVAFYDKDGFQARVAANWRDSYLDHFGQAQNNSMFGSEPTFVNANTQIDFSTSYDVTPQLNIYLSALNLNDSTYGTRGRFAEQLLDAVDYGRRFTMGFRFRY